MINVSNPAKPEVTAKVKTGILIHAPADSGKAVGGSSPNALLVYKDTLYVTNANNDTVQYLDARTLEIRKTVKLAPEPTLSTLRGVIPSGRRNETICLCFGVKCHRSHRYCHRYSRKLDPYGLVPNRLQAFDGSAHALRRNAKRAWFGTARGET
jgi:DNA-binding beta-propeller fold protein YncE